GETLRPPQRHGRKEARDYDASRLGDARVDVPYHIVHATAELRDVDLVPLRRLLQLLDAQHVTEKVVLRAGAERLQAGGRPGLGRRRGVADEGIVSEIVVVGGLRSIDRRQHLEAGGQRPDSAERVGARQARQRLAQRAGRAQLERGVEARLRRRQETMPLDGVAACVAGVARHAHGLPLDPLEVRLAEYETGYLA